MPKFKDESEAAPVGDTLRRLWSNRPYRFGVVAQFFYVGVQTCVWSFTIRYVMSELDCLEKDASMFFSTPYSRLHYSGLCSHGL